MKRNILVSMTAGAGVFLLLFLFYIYKPNPYSFEEAVMMSAVTALIPGVIFAVFLIIVSMVKNKKKNA